MSIKYKYSFVSKDGYNCEVRFDFAGYTGVENILSGGMRPFVLREFNTDADFFKPLRGLQAEMEILADENISMDDFIQDEDDTITVQFYFDDVLFWKGSLLQDDFQENWIDTYHFITLRASDGFGQINASAFPELSGQYSMFAMLEYATNSTVFGSNPFYQSRIICNLFYDGMTSNIPLSDATVDAKTFEGDDKSKVVDKINRAWSMTMFQYNAKLWLIRLEEFLNDLDLNGYQYNSFISNVAFTNDFKVNIGTGEAIKPVMPEMLRMVKRRVKRDRINFYYRFPSEIICNQTFLRGASLTTSSSYDTFAIDCWTLYKDSIGTPVAGTVNKWRRADKDGDGNITDNYALMESPGLGNFTYLKSSGTGLNAGDTLELNFDFRYRGATITGPANRTVGYVLFEDGTNKYTLDDDGSWNLSNSSYTTNVKTLNMSYSSIEVLGDWKNYTVKSKALPASGTVYFLLANFPPQSGSEANFKGLDLTIREASKQPGVIGDYDQYEKTEVINTNFEEETFLDDSNNRQHKGAIHFSGALTGDSWYRADFNTERLTFKRHKAIAHMNLNRRHRMKLEVNLYGLTWTFNSETRPIGLMNKFVFVDDAPTKVFMILNLSEMDFSEAVWRATLLEVWDSAIDDADPAGYPPHSFANIYEKDV